MIKKWIIAGVAYILIVIIGFNLYTSFAGNPTDDSQKVNHEMKTDR
jgi:uncharacterized membrane-anchored protein YhcB (DUF1043 family)